MCECCFLRSKELLKRLCRPCANTLVASADRTSAYCSVDIQGDCADLVAFWQADAIFNLPVGLAACTICLTRLSLLTGSICEPCRTSLDAMDERNPGGEALQFVMGTHHGTVAILIAQNARVV